MIFKSSEQKAIIFAFIIMTLMNIVSSIESFVFRNRIEKLEKVTQLLQEK